ncbi:MAG: hypothetical protein ACLFML_06055, partial [Desulfobacterales bacterium]
LLLPLDTEICFFLQVKYITLFITTEKLSAWMTATPGETKKGEQILHRKIFIEIDIGIGIAIGIAIGIDKDPGSCS